MSDRLILEGKDIQKINDKALRVDELYLLYHLLRYVEDDKGTTIPEIQARYCWDKERGGKEIRPTCQVFKTLAESGNTVTRAIASAVTLKEHDYFSNIAVAKYDKYGKHVRLNQRYHDDFKTSVALCSIGLVGDMLTAPIGFLKTLSQRTLQPWQH